MLELSMHILDIVENSIRAGATLVSITIEEDLEGDRFRIEITDDGSGMDAETCRKAVDPFYTTKTVRRVGLGLPLFRQAAEMTNGSFSIRCGSSGGTTVSAEFQRSHIDRQPLGDMASTLKALLAGNPAMDLVYTHGRAGASYRLDTREIRGALDGIPMDHPEVLRLIGENVRDGLREIKANQ
ncbi:MAG TPA: ATP-binding protein [Syntrophales bacterium]|nr:ATP-binding protein [Syntrophales bacterium]